MRVTLLVEALASPLSGIGRYCLELAQRLPANPSIDELKFRIPGRWITSPIEYLERRETKQGKRFLPKSIVNGLDRRALRRSVVHGPNYFLPREVESGVITIHDLSVFKFPQMHPVDRVAQFERDFQSSVSRASHIITDTEVVRQEVIEFTGCSPDRISVVHLGVSTDYHPRSAQQLDPLLGRYALKAGYALCVSTLEPRKRISSLLNVWARLPALLQKQHPLVLAGPAGWLNEQLHDQIRLGEEKGWLRFLDFVPEQDLPLLYAGTHLFIYPSIYEGFGLPPVEAMASGAPVIVSNRSCLGEVCGDAAMMIDPDDEDGFLEAVMRGLTDNDWRKVASSLGRERSGRFDWSRCVNDTVDIYKIVS